MQRRFYEDQYVMKATDYYKQLLKYELMYRRHPWKDEPDPKRLPSNCIRFILGKITRKHLMKDR